MPKAVRVYRGDTWSRAWELRDRGGAPIDLTGALARLHLRDSSGALVVSGDTGDGRIVITPADGRIDMTIPYPAMDLAPGAYRFDLEVTHADGTRYTYEQGVLAVLEDMTHD